MNRRILVLTGLALTLAWGCVEPSSSPTTEEIPGAVLPDNWTPSGSAADADAFFWETFQQQRYQDVPELFDRLFGALEEAEEPFTLALMNGRVAWMLLWVSSEADYAATVPEVPTSPPGLALPDIPRDANGEPYDLFAGVEAYYEAGEAMLEAEGVEVLVSHPKILGVQMAIHYFGEATRLLMDHEATPPVQLQNWTGADTLAWRTFPGVATGFYAAFDGFPGGDGDTRTMAMSATNDAVSYSLGFNFATDVFGHVGDW